MIGFVLAFIIFLVLTYILYRTYQYLSFNHKVQIIGSIILSLYFYGGLLSYVIGFFLKNGTSLKQTLIRIGYYWVGTILYFAIGLLFAIVIRTIIYRYKKCSIRKLKQISFLFIFFFTVIMSTIGIAKAHDLRVTNYEIDINKESTIDELNVVYVCDLHLGFNDNYEVVKDMVDTINSLNADVVLIGGDIFDNDFDAIYKPEEMINKLKQIESKYGTYAIYGNHDICENLFLGFTVDLKNKNKNKIDDRMLDFINQANIKTLYDEYIQIEDVYIYGRPDYEKPNFNNETRLSEEELMSSMNNNKPIIVLDHEPRGAKQLSQLGADLLLAGHTHAGQIWPGTISINWFWDNAYGYQRVNDLHYIVSSGVGLFGINMRTGCIAEVCDIKIKFN